MVKTLRIAFFLLSALLATGVFAQTYSIKGSVTDSTGKQVLIGATVIVFKPGDTLALTGCSTDTLGKFNLPGLPDGRYKMKFMYPGYAQTKRFVMIQGADFDLGQVKLKNDGIVMSEAEIRDVQVRVTQNGDTTIFNAGAYKVNQDATAEDLLLKMPGVTNDGTGPKVHGDDIKQVMVDGKPFFGDDPNAALKNIPADMVDQIQVYDQSSDQARMTGFDDGNARKTVNIITKNGGMNGAFGKFYAGYGTDDRYSSGITFNRFDGDRRFTLLGMSNNINVQNFSTADIFGTAGGSGGPKMMMGGRGSGGGGYGRGGAANFIMPTMGGISTTHAIGMNYSDQWGSKVKVSGSYFFNYSENVNQTILTRNYFTTNDSSLVYNDSSITNTRNINHRLNFKMDITIDTMNSLVLSTKFTSQFTGYGKYDFGENILAEAILQSSSTTRNSSTNLGFTTSNNATYKHRFRKTGRTIVFDLSHSMTNRDGEGQYYADSYYQSSGSTIIDQQSTSVSRSNTITPTISWTEPAGKKGQILFSVSSSLAMNKMNKETNDLDASAESYTVLDSSLSNRYENIYQYGKGGVAYKYNGDKATLTLGTDYQYSSLRGIQEFPSAQSISHFYHSVLPNMVYNYKFSKTSNLKLTYRTSNVAPAISQLQDVVDNSNPLQLKTGNPDLAQDYENTFIGHFGSSNSTTGRGIFIFMYGSITRNYIGNSTFIASSDTTLGNVFLNRGSQLTKPVNLKGYRTGKLYITYSLPLPKAKMNLGLSMSGGYSRTPGLINDVLNNADNTSVGPGITLSSNISEAVDFTIGYNGTYNLVSNSLQSQTNSGYFQHTASAKATITLKKKLVLNTSAEQYFYSGLGEGYNTDYLLWNAYIAYKFLKNRSLEAKVSATDLLKQNVSIARTVNETYIEDSRTDVLQQYFMFTLTWNLKKFKTNTPANGSDAPSSSGVH